MDLNNKLKIVTICLLVTIVLCLILLSNNFSRAKDSCEMRFGELADFNGVQGVWYLDNNEEYVCAWIDSEINDSKSHEMCHSFVYNDYDHFCQEEYEK